MFILNVLRPEPVIIVEIVYWLHVRYFFLDCFNFVNFRVGLTIKICHTAFNLRLNLEIGNVHFLFQDARSLLFSLFALHAVYHLLSNRNLLLFIVDAFTKHGSNVLVHFNHLVV